MADNTDKLLKDIIRALGSLELAATSPEIDFSPLNDRLVRIADRLEGVQDAIERQIGVLYEIRDAIAAED